MRVLTGIKPTGRPHLGNYLGSIRPAIALSRERETYLFIADLHALTTIRNREDLRELVYDVAATWLACGLDPEKTVFYRQSDVPEISELNWILACYTSQGLLERAHAYKAAKDAGEDVNVGLYTYPVLMSADILAFDSTHVSVGQDQKQHLEICRDIAERFNHYHGEVLTIPAPIIDENVAVIPGLDGRKMSKSYGNTIPLFFERETVKKKIMSIVSDSTPLEEPKDPESSLVYRLYAMMAPKDRAEAMAGKLRAGGYGWGHAKKELIELFHEQFDEKAKVYDHLMANRGELDAVFAKGAKRARAKAGATLERAKKALGLA